MLGVVNDDNDIKVHMHKTFPLASESTINLCIINFPFNSFVFITISQLKLAEKHEDTDILLWEEKIKLAEEDAQKALERAEKAERRVAELERSRPPQRKSNLMSKISYFENGGNEKKEDRVETLQVSQEIKEVAGKYFSQALINKISHLNNMLLLDTQKWINFLQD